MKLFDSIKLKRDLPVQQAWLKDNIVAKIGARGVVLDVLKASDLRPYYLIEIFDGDASLGCMHVFEDDLELVQTY
jgi:hypothetical protein